MEDFREAIAGHFSRPAILTAPSGRYALARLLEHLGLRPADEVYITTTFDHPNVSACVTCTVFNYCKPSRVLTEATRLILVIHEFGVPHPRIEALAAVARARGIPLLEDCAHTVSSEGPAGPVGRLGDWTLVSWPKVLAVSAGGMLLGPERIAPDAPGGDWPKTAARWWASWPEQAARRRELFTGLARRLCAARLSPVIQLDRGVVPWFFPVRFPRPDAAQRALSAAAIDNGRWHGTDIVVLPCHQFLTEADLDRIAAAVGELG